MKHFKFVILFVIVLLFSCQEKSSPSKLSTYSFGKLKLSSTHHIDSVSHETGASVYFDSIERVELKVCYIEYDKVVKENFDTSQAHSLDEYKFYKNYWHAKSCDVVATKFGKTVMIEYGVKDSITYQHLNKNKDGRDAITGITPIITEAAFNRLKKISWIDVEFPINNLKIQLFLKFPTYKMRRQEAIQIMKELIDSVELIDN